MNTHRKINIIQVCLNAKDFSLLREVKKKKGYKSNSAFIRGIIQQEIKKPAGDRTSLTGSKINPSIK